MSTHPLTILARAMQEHGWPCSAGDLARAGLAALEEAGYVVVPREPTGDEIGYRNMKREGAAKMWDVTRGGEIVGLDQAAAIYRAMIEAAKEKGG